MSAGFPLTTPPISIHQWWKVTLIHVITIFNTSPSLGSPPKVTPRATEVSTVEIGLHYPVSVSPWKSSTGNSGTSMFLWNLAAKCPGTLLSPWCSLKSPAVPWDPAESTMLPCTPTAAHRSSAIGCLRSGCAWTCPVPTLAGPLELLEQWWWGEQILARTCERSLPGHTQTAQRNTIWPVSACGEVWNSFSSGAQSVPETIISFSYSLDLGSSQGMGRSQSTYKPASLIPWSWPSISLRGGLPQLCLGCGDQESSITADDLYQKGGGF